MHTDGYDDNGDYYSAEYDDEEMPATERELADDAQWKVIQKNTFTRWTNEHLKQANKSIASLESDLSDGLRLCALIEVLSGKKFKRVNKRPNFRSQKLENVTTALKFLEEDEGIKIVNIDSTDIVDSKLKLILGLIWTLILHYSISMPMWEGEEDMHQGDAKEGPTPKQRLLIWVQNKLPEVPVRNFTTDWNDGKAIGALVDAVGPGLCPDWEDWDPNQGKKNATEAMDLAEEWLEVPKLIMPEDMVNPKIDELSMMTYLSQFPNAKLKNGAPLRPRTNAARVRAYGPGLEKTGNCKGRPANFKIDTFAAGKGEPAVVVTNPQGKPEKCEVVFNNDRNLTYSCSYSPSMEGTYTVKISFAGREIPKSPYTVKVEGAAGDAEKVTAEGPGLQATGVQHSKKTSFEIFTEGAGVGNIEVVIVDAHGHKDTCKPRISKTTETTYYVEYMAKEVGRYSVHIYFAGKEIPLSPYTVNVGAQTPGAPAAPGPKQPQQQKSKGGWKPKPKGPAETKPQAVEPKKAYATGRGVQAKGVRVKDVADITVHTEGAGKADLVGTIVGPTDVTDEGDQASPDEALEDEITPGRSEPLKFKKLDDNTYETNYKPTQPGSYTVNLQYGGGHIAKSPFKVQVLPYKESKIRAYGPGLEGGMVGKPADFVVETNGETGALGFAIEGPSQAKINCSDNGDGSADVSYMPTQPGEYAVHVLCDNEDIPKSPFMAMIAPTMPSSVGNGDMIMPDEEIMAQRAPGQHSAPNGSHMSPNGVDEDMINPDSARKAHSMYPNGAFSGDFEPTEVVASGPGLEKNGVVQGKPAKFTVDTRKAGNAPLKVYGEDVNGKPIDVKVKDNGDGTYDCQYNPKEPIKHTVIVTFGGCNVPKSPFRVYVEEPSSPDKVKVFGPGIEKGVTVNEGTHFFVDCTEAGPGDVAISLTDDKGMDVPVDAEDNGEGLFRIEYEPKSVGTYTVNVIFADQEIPSSPYTVKIEPNIDVSGVKVLGLEKGFSVNKLTRFQVRDSLKVRKLFVSVVIRSPRGKVLSPLVSAVSDGCNVSFTPREIGQYSIEVYANGKPIIDSPFKVNCTGTGAEKIEPTDVPKLKFSNPEQSDTTDKGKGKPWNRKPADDDSQQKPGDKKRKPWEKKTPDDETDKPRRGKFGPVDDGQPEWMNPQLKGFKKKQPPKPVEEPEVQERDIQPVQKTPQQSEMDAANLKPWQRKPGQKDNASKVKVYGDGITTGEVNKTCKFIVDTTESGPGALDYSITGPANITLTPKEIGPGKSEVSYVPTMSGIYTITVTFNKAQVPKSPFKPNIKWGPKTGPHDDSPLSKVKVYGNGLTTGKANEPAIFTVDTSLAGPGGLGFEIKGPSQPTMTTKDLGRGKCQVTYTPTLPGRYTIDVLYKSSKLPACPYTPTITSRTEKSVRVYGDGLTTGESGSPASFIVDTTEVGPGRLGFDIQGPSKPKLSTKDLSPGKCEVTYIPTEVGAYTVEVTYNGKKVPSSPFKPVITAATMLNPEDKVQVYGDGITTCEVNKPAMFVVDTSESGPGKLTFDINGPSKPKLTTKDISPTKCEVTYSPTKVGTYTIEISYNGKQVAKSPFKPQIKPAGKVNPIDKVKVYGDGITTGEANKPVSFIVDTTEAGPAKLGFDINGPSKPKLSTKDIAPGKCEVTYIPTMVGIYTINITYNSKPVPDSPFKPQIKPTGEVTPADKVKVYGDGITLAVADRPTTFIVDITDSGPGSIGFDMKGPSKPKMTSKYITSTKCEVTYTAAVVGGYTIDVTFNGKSVPDAPFKPQVKRAIDLTPAEKVKVYGDGLIAPEVNKPTSFVVDTTEVGPGRLGFDISGPSKPMVTTKDISPGRCEVTYTPTAVGPHDVVVTYNAQPVPGSPFKPTVKVAKSPAEKVKVYGDGIVLAVTNKPAQFIVDTTKAGPGKLGFDMKGPSKPKITTKNINPEKCEVTYTPTAVGSYTIDVTFDSVSVPDAPFKPTVKRPNELTPAEKVKVHGDGLIAPEVNKPTTFVVDTTEAGPGKLGFDISGPSKPKISTKDIAPGKCEVTYTPTAVGPHDVGVTYNGQPVPGSPFKPTVEPAKGPAEKVKVYGDGIVLAVTNKPAKFIVDTTKSGPGKLGFDVKGPSKPKLTTQNITPEKYEVTYIPTAVGSYSINVTYDDESVPDAPFKPTVKRPNELTPAEKVKVHGDGVIAPEVNKPTTFVVDTTEAGPGKLGFDISGPSKPKISTKEIAPGKCEVTYTPTAVGPHDVGVTYNGQPVPGSPFKPTVEPAKSPAEKVKVYGDGIVLAVTNKPAKFFVDTTKSGPGKLGFDVKGPSKPKLTTQNITPEKCEVTYTPTAVGSYSINVTYDDESVPDAPFKPTVKRPNELTPAEKVKVHGDGLIVPEVNKPATFVVDTTEAGPGKLGFDISGPSKPKISTKEIAPGKCEVTYTPTAVGPHDVGVTYNSQPVPGSPFKPTVEPAESSAQKVRVYGDGIVLAVANRPTTFTVDTTEAGPGKLGFDVKGPSKPRMTTKNITPEKCEVTYTPTAIGSYAIDVTFDDESVPDSPFKPMVKRATDLTPAEKVKVHGDGLIAPEVNKPTTFMVDTSEAGPGRLGFDISGPSKPKISTKDMAPGKCEVAYTPTAVGPHEVGVTYNGQPVPGSPFKPTVKETSSDMTAVKVNVYGPGITTGETGKPLKFIVDMTESGPGRLGLDIQGPSKPAITTADLGDNKCEVSYLVSQSGIYSIYVTYDDSLVPGAPFRPDIYPAVSKTRPSNLVRVYGDGIVAGTENMPNEFIVDTTESGTGKLEFGVQGPGKATVTTSDIEKNKCAVSYIPELPGKYFVSVSYDGELVPDAPYCVDIKPSPYSPQKSGLSPRQATDDRIAPQNVDAQQAPTYANPLQCPATKVKVYGEGVDHGVCDEVTSFVVDTSESGPGKLGFGIRGPAKAELKPTDLGEDKVLVSYVPKKPGKYTVDVTYDDKSISVAPFDTQIVPAEQIIPQSARRPQHSAPVDRITPQSADDQQAPTSVNPLQCPDTKVKVYGEGVDHGVCDEVTSFVVDTSESGPGKLGFGIRGPAKAELKPTDLGEDKVLVSYVPKKHGKYTVDVTYDDKLISVAPFDTQIVPAEQIIPQSARRPQHSAPVDRITPQSADDQQAPTSVNPLQCPDSKVKVYGEGVEYGVCDEVTSFVVDTSESGPGKLGFGIRGPAKAELKPTDLGEDKVLVSYVPTKPGQYTVDVTYDDKPISVTPFDTQIVPSDQVTPQSARRPQHRLPGDQQAPSSYNPLQCPATKVKVYGEGVDYGVCDEVTSFVVDTSESGPGKLGFGIRGPAKAELKPTDLGNDKVLVSYVPKKPGKYTVDVTYDDKPISVAPFDTQIVPSEQITPQSARRPQHSAHGDLITPQSADDQQAPTSVNPLQCPDTKVKVYGEGVDHGVCDEVTSFVVDTSESGPGKLGFGIRGPAKAELKPTDLGEDKVLVSYVPTKPGKYTVDVTYDDKPISVAPFDTQIVPSDQITPQSAKRPQHRTPGDQQAPTSANPLQCPASKVKVYGEGVDYGVCDEVTSFVVDTSESGPGKLGFGIRGPAKSELKPTDLGNDKVLVSYVPKKPGKYTVDVTYDDKPISVAPFDTQIVPSEQITPQSARRPQHSSPGDLITPQSADDQQAPTSVNPLQCPDTKVKVYGDGVDHGFCDEVTSFVVDTSESGPGKLGFGIRGPAKAELKPTDLGDDKVLVSYVPTKPGKYTVDVTYDDKPIAVTPFDTQIMPSDQITPQSAKRPQHGAPGDQQAPTSANPLQCPTTKVKVYGEGVEYGVCDEVTSFVVDTSESGPGKLGFGIRGPAKAELKPTDLGNDKVLVSYVPKKPGKYTVDVTYDDKPISVAPFDTQIVPTEQITPKSARRPQHGAPGITPQSADDQQAPTSVNPLQCPDTKVKVYGEGVDHGVCDEVTSFVVDTSESGPGKLGFGIRGPAQVELKPTDLGEDKVLVSYVPTKPGKYTVDVTYDDKPISVTPFDTQIVPSDQITPQFAKRPQHGAPGNQQAPTSANPLQCPTTKVKVYGEGVDYGVCDEVTSFVVDTSESRPGKLGFGIRGPAKAELKPTDLGNDKVLVSYVPQKPGKYTVDVTYDDKPISVAPFDTQIVPSEQITPQSARRPQHSAPGDRITPQSADDQQAPTSVNPIQCPDTKVKVYGEGVDHGVCDEVTSFVVDTSESGPGKLGFGIRGPAKAELKPTDLGNNKVLVSYVPKKPGKYTVDVTYDDKPISVTPFDTQIVPSDQITPQSARRPQHRAPGDGITPQSDDDQQAPTSVNPLQCPVTKVKVYGEGVDHGVCDEVISFVVDTSESGPGKLGFGIRGPSKAELKPTDLGDNKVLVSYVPNKPGKYTVDVTYDDKPITVAPFDTQVVPSDQITPQFARRPQHSAPGHRFNPQSADEPQAPTSAIPLQCPATKVKLYGDGVRFGVCDEVTSFVVDTSESGPGNLGFNIIGPAKTELKPSDVGNGKVLVSYVPIQPGEYTIEVTFEEQPISVTPFKTQIVPSDQIIPKTARRPQHQAPGDQIAPQAVDEQQAPTSANPLQCPNTKVKVYGEGVDYGVCDEVTSFIVDTSESGPGKLGFGIRGPSTVDLRPKDISNTKVQVSYVPSQPGDYLVDVTFEDKPITVAPFKTHIVPVEQMTIESLDKPRKKCPHTGVELTGFGIHAGVKDEPTSFAVDMTESGPGKLSFGIRGPGKPELVTKELDNGMCEVSFLPDEPGEYVLEVFFNGQLLFGIPLTIQIVHTWEEVVKIIREVQTQEYTRLVQQTTTDDGIVESTTTTTTTRRESGAGDTFRREMVTTREIHSTIRRGSPRVNEPIHPSGSAPVQSLPDESVIVPEGQTRQQQQPQRAPRWKPEFGSTDLNDVEIVIDDDTQWQDSSEVSEEFISATQKPQHSQPQLEDIESSFTISADAVVEDSFDTIKHSHTDTETADFGEFIIESSTETTEQAFSVPNQARYENTETEDIETTFTISPDAIVEESFDRVRHAQPHHSQPDDQVDESAIQPTKIDKQRNMPRFAAEPQTVEMQQPEKRLLDSSSAVTPVRPEDRPEPTGPAAKVDVTGDCLERALVNTPETFDVDMTKSGPGKLNFTVRGPSEPELKVKDMGNNKCQVTFLPKEIGTYLIEVTLDGQHVKGSPFVVYVTSNKNLDLSRVTTTIQRDVFIDSTTDFTVDAASVSPVGEGKLRAIITSPSGTKNDTMVTNNGDGTYNVAYAPYEEGPHEIDVTYEGLPIPGSPLSVEVVPGNDPTRVKAYGPGLEKAQTNQPQQFTIETKGAGQGGLALAVEGPSKAQVQCTDNHDGTCTVDYTPTKAGDYDITVKFADQDIPGSPFKVPVEDKIDPSKVKVHGPGVNPEGVRATQAAPFTVDCTEAGKAPLKATVDDGSGPKPVEMKEVDEGIFECAYVPKEQGAPCRLDITYDDEPVPGSPFEQTVLPPHDASKVKVSGPGIDDGILASLPTEFTVDTTDAGVADLDVAIQAPDGRYLRPDITDNKDATVTVHYTPEDVGKYNAKIKYGGDPIPGSPFDVNTRPSGDASKCQITDPVKRVVVDEECVITVNTEDAGQGNITCRIRTPSDTDADIDIVDNNDGTVSIFFTPHTPGNYGISIKFGGVPIPEGDYDIEAVPEEEMAVDEADVIPLHKENSHSAAPGSGYPSMFHPVDFVIPVGPIFAYVLAEVEAPSGNRSPVQIRDNGDGTVTVNYQPTEVGLHNLHVFYNDEPLEGSPYQFHVDAVDSGMVSAFGPGLSYGVAGEPCTFTIDTKNAGAGGLNVSVQGPRKAPIVIKDNGNQTCTVTFTPEVAGTYNITVTSGGRNIGGSPYKCHVMGSGLPGGLSLAVEGPSKAEIVCQDNDDGTCTVTYLPTEPGLYNVVVKFDDDHIVGSPFTAYIAGEAGKEKAQLSMGQASEFSLSVEEYDINELEADITSPSGKSEPCILKKLPNGHLGISFTPHETGTHLVNVYRDGQHIANSPFKINVTRNEVGNADKVKVYGDGLTNGMANEVNEFYVDTKDAGYGGLSLSIEGPSKADIDCKDRPDGSTAVNYKPTQPGNYVISIKFADDHVPGSPFNCKVGGATGINEESMLTSQQRAADITHVGSSCELSLKIPGSDPMEMVASVTSPSGITELCDVMDTTEDHYTIKFVPKEMGPHIVCVKHKGLNIPGSPFQFTVGPITEGGAHRVHANGPGLERGEVEIENEFNIYTREAGSGGLAISVEGPSKAEIKFTDKNDGSSVVAYTCTDPGEYVVTIKFNDEHIPDSPFRVPVLPSSGDARNVTVEALKQKGLEIGKPAAFTACFNGAKGELNAKVVAPSGAEDEALCQSLDDSNSRHAVRFIPRENGVHFVHVTLNRSHIRGSPFKVIVGDQEPDPAVVTATGKGLKTAETGANNKFTVHTVGAGSASLAVTVDGPSKVKLDAKEVADGYEFTYSPSAPGTYYVTIKYGGNHHIAGSPFKVACTGSGTPGANQSAHCVVETEKKTEADLANALPKFNSDGAKCTSKGPGLAKAFVNKKAQFTVDTSHAGQNMLFVGMVGPANSPPVDEIHIKHQDRMKNTYNVSYTVKQKGRYMLLVKWGDDHIPGSPFNIEVI